MTATIPGHLLSAVFTDSDWVQDFTFLTAGAPRDFTGSTFSLALDPVAKAKGEAAFMLDTAGGGLVVTGGTVGIRVSDQAMQGREALRYRFGLREHRADGGITTLAVGEVTINEGVSRGVANPALTIGSPAVGQGGSITIDATPRGIEIHLSGAGPMGQSAYQAAVVAGFEGTLEDWLVATGADGQAEASRVEAEDGRATAEDARAEAEQGRVAFAIDLAQAADGWAAAEQGRAGAEGGRVTAEGARTTAEAARVTETAAAVAAANAAATAANGAAAAAALGVSGVLTNVGYDTLTQRGTGSFTAVAASGYRYLTQPLAVPVAVGGKVTVFYRSDDAGTGAGTRISLFRPGTGIISALPSLIRDGSMQAVTLTNTGALSATAIAFDSNGASSYALKYIVLPGALTDLTPAVSALASSLMALADMASAPDRDLTLRNMGLVSGPAVNTSMDTLTNNGLGDVSFVEASGAISYARSPILTVATGAKATLIYRVVPIGSTAPATGSVRATLERLGFGGASSTVSLIPDGLTRTITFTASQDANRILWDATTANLRVIFTLLPGDVAETTPSSTGLQAALLALSNALAAPMGGEVWTDDDKLVLWPTPVAFVTGRETAIYGRQVVKGRKRQFNLDLTLVSTAAESANDPGFMRQASPDLRIRGEQLPAATCYFDVRDPALPAQMRRRVFTRYLANAAQTGTVLFTIVGDSTAALALNALRQRVIAAGAAFTGKGTLTSGGIGFEGRSGWSALNYLGKARPGANPFLRPLSVAVPGELAIIQANPTVCFADDAGFGTGNRPSYAEDATRASYSIFDWSYWRTNGAVALDGTEKLRAAVQLGRNGTSSATWVADNELAHTRIVESFRASFPNGSIFVISEVIGEATDTVNSLAVPTAYRDRTAPLIQMKLKAFSNREADRVWVVPAWAMMNAFAGYGLSAATATDADTGTTTHTVSDVVHYGSEVAIQWAEAVLAPLLYVHQTT